MFNKDITAQSIIQYATPFLGTWRGLPGHIVPQNALFDSLNVYIRNGELVTRPGFGQQYGSGGLTATVIGGGLYDTGVEEQLIGINRFNVHSLDGPSGVWSNVGSVTLPDRPCPYNVFDNAGTIVGVFGSGGRLYTYDGAVISEVTPSVGTIPDIVDFDIVFDRIVAIERPYNVRWTSALDLTNWAALNIVRKSEGGDRVVAIKRLSNNSFALYKEKTIYVALAQGGSDAGAFGFRDFRGQYEGPAGIHSIVDVEGSHVYMTPSGRIGSFDGSRHAWIADGIWPFLREDINQALANKIFGFYNTVLNVVVFVYGKQNGGKGLVLINPQNQSIGIQTTAYFLGQSDIGLEYGFSFKRDGILEESICFGNNIGISFIEENKTDLGQVYDCYIQTPIMPFETLDHNFINAEAFLERGDGYGVVNMKMIFSDILGSRGGSIGEGFHTLDLNEEKPNEYIGFTTTGRYVGLRFEWMSDAVVKYKGSIIYGRGVMGQQGLR